MPIATAAALAMGLGAAASGAAGIAGHMAQMSAQERAQLLQEKGVQEWLNVQIPDPATRKLALQKFVQVGEIHPALAPALKQAETSLSKIQQDPALKEARMRALSSLEQTGYGGENIADKAAQESAQIQAGATNRGHQQAITSDMAHRGQLGSGLELQARLAANQGDSDANTKNALDMEAQRRQRALTAVSGAGSLAGNIESQDYAEKSDAAKAADAINMFNTKNTQDVTNSNVDRSNAAQVANLQQKQKTSDQNTGLNNFQQQYNSELGQQNFENQAKKAAGVSGQYGQQAQGAINAGQSAAQMWGNIAGGIGSTAQGVAGLSQSSTNAAKDKQIQDLQDENKKWSDNYLGGQ